MRKSEKHQALLTRGRELLLMFDTLERLDEDGDVVFNTRRKMREACYDLGGRGAAYVGRHPEFGFTDYHDDCDYCALIFAYRNRRKAG